MKYLGLLTMAAVFAVASIASVAAENVVSLRGASKLADDAKMFEKKRIKSQQGGYKRAWKLQPPSIPHTIAKDRINLEENTCLRCHSPDNFKEKKAIKIGDSHFLDAAGKKSAKVNGRRYFCVQCHTPLNNVDPLVENTFNSADK